MTLQKLDHAPLAGGPISAANRVAPMLLQKTPFAGPMNLQTGSLCLCLHHSSCQG
jgi:hypothetical protein